MRTGKRWMMMLVGLVFVGFISGCTGLRIAPGERQKQNAYLHHRTVQAAAMKAQSEDSSAVLKQLTSKAANQSDAVMVYYGMPQEVPASQSIEEILSPDNDAVTAGARASALERPDPWAVADHLLELGLGVAGLVGGAFGVRAVSALRLAQEKSKALREVINGNELFKKDYPESIGAFKAAHQDQSKATQTLVTAMK